MPQAAFELAISHALLTRVAARRAADARCGSTARRRPWPSGSSTRCGPGSPRRVEAARAHGYEPVLRLPGGHAAAYHARVAVHRRRLGARRPDPGHARALRVRGRAARGRAAHARRRRARGGGAGRVLPGRLLGQRARAREADRHRPAAGPRRGAARRVDRRRRRAGHPRRARRRVRGAGVRRGTRRPPARSTRRSPASRRRGARPRCSPRTTSPRLRARRRHAGAGAAARAERALPSQA